MSDQEGATTATGWVVKEAAPTFGLDDARKAEVTFTVTNSGPVQDRAVFDMVPEGAADAAWFSVDEPQRAVAPGDSAQYLVKVAVAAAAPAGEYAVQGRAYSADRPPEESSRLSGRVAFEVAPPLKPPAKPWWLIPIGVAVLVVLAVVAFLVLRGGDDVATGFTKGTTAPALLVPDLATLTEDEATAALEEAGLAVGEIRHLHNTTVPAGQVTGQTVPADTEVESGTAVGLDVAIALTAPVLLSPGDGTTFATTTAPQPLTWAPVEEAADYSVVVQQPANFCTIPHDFDFNPLVGRGPAQQPPPVTIGGDVIAIDDSLITVIDLSDLCAVIAVDSGTVAATTFSPAINFTAPGTYQWRVAARDDAGTPGPASGFFQFTITTV